MSFNGSGIFVRLYNWVNDAAANIKIRADRMDNEMDGMATGLTTCITKDGQTTITANLPMAGFLHTGVGNGSSRNHYAAVGQVQDGKINWVAAGGTADAITASYAIPVTALVDGELFYVRASAANATATPTFSPSTLTAHTITKAGGQALVANDIYGAGHEIILRYNLANTRYELLNPAPQAVPATTAFSALSSATNTTAAMVVGTGASIAATGSGTIHATLSDTVTTNANLTGPITSVGNAVASLSAHAVLIGNGTSAIATVAPSTSGNVLTSNGTDWASTAPASSAPGLTTIASGNLATGSPTVVDISSIPATYRAITLYIKSASNSVATRALRVDVDTGSGFGNAANCSEYTQIATTTPTNVSGAANRLWTDVTQTAAQQTQVIVRFPAYQSGPIKQYTARVATASTSDAWGTGPIQINGVLTDASSVARTTAIVGIRITWDNVATGVFDNGTYALYGEN